jgi:hypothetical protein
LFVKEPQKSRSDATGGTAVLPSLFFRRMSPAGQRAEVITRPEQQIVRLGPNGRFGEFFEHLRQNGWQSSHRTDLIDRTVQTGHFDCSPRAAGRFSAECCADRCPSNSFHGDGPTAKQSKIRFLQLFVVLSFVYIFHSLWLHIIHVFFVFTEQSKCTDSLVSQLLVASTIIFSKSGKRTKKIEGTKETFPSLEVRRSIALAS